MKFLSTYNYYIIENRISDIENKYNKLIDDDIVNYFKENDPTKNKAYFQWLCDRYSKLDSKKENPPKDLSKEIETFNNNMTKKEIIEDYIYHKFSDMIEEIDYIFNIDIEFEEINDDFIDFFKDYIDYKEILIMIIHHLNFKEIIEALNI